MKTSSSPIQKEVDLLSHKFFVGPGNDEIFRKWGQQAIELALEWLKNPEEKKIHAEISIRCLSDLFSNIDIPQHGSDIENVFSECKKNILENSVRVNNPRYIGHMTTAVPWFSVVVDILTTSINQNQVKIETALASSFVERQTLAWLHRLVYNFPDEFYQDCIQNHTKALGNMTGGGTVGNLTALMVARETKFPGVRQKGLLNILGKMNFSDIVILASKRVHYSITKCAGILGLGESSVIELPVDYNNRMRLDALEEKLEELKKKNVAVLALVGIGGTTETGNVDPLAEMAEIARRENIWFHVDSAWGGAFLLSSELRHVLRGIELADSVVLDGHKLFYLPLSHGSVLFKNPQFLDRLRHNTRYILRIGSIDLGRTTLEGSRRFNALKLWFSLKVLGMEGYDVLLKKSVRLTEIMKKFIDQDPDFERTSEPEICIITYRFVPESWQERLINLRDENSYEEIRKMNNQLNEINIELQKRQREFGKSFVSRTSLESAGYPQEISVLRVILTNLLTKEEFLKEILEEQRQIGFSIIDDLKILD